MKTLVVLLLASLLVAAPYKIVLRPAGAVTLKELPISSAAEGQCPQGAVIKLELADGRMLALGENEHAIMAEPSESGYPVITLGVWHAETSELELHPQTKHQTQPGDSLCRDLFSEES
jgi:hypothetical protein